jgi:lysozyme
MNKPLVIDIYHLDPVLDFSAVKNAGIIGVIHKSTESTGMRDRLYPVRRKAFTDIGMKWGCYHFFHGGGADEADYFLDYATPDDDTLIALDWETTSSGYVPSADEARAFLERVEEKLGRKAVIYSGNVAKEQVKGKDAYFGAHRLWLAQYGTKWSVQQSWTTPWLHQNNGDRDGPGPHTIPGIKGYCDNSTIVDPMTVLDLLQGWAS